MYYIGIDLGTSAVKLLLVEEDGTIANALSRDYPLEYPQPGWSQQDPADWAQAVLEGIPALLKGFDPSLVQAIGCAGQMHALVILDREDRVIRPAILWNDGRTVRETEWLNTTLGKETLSARTANIAFAGFTAPKLLWLRAHEEENFRRLAKVMLPKDYINYLLTGVHSTDYSDASGTLLLDVAHKCWSPQMLELCGLTPAQMPRLYESWQPVGTLRPQLAARLGLSPRVIVCAGAGDNAAAAVGTGTVGEGRCTISLGTSGTVFISSATFRAGAQNALHAFAHADGGYHLMGCMLSAASCNKWLLEDLFLTRDYAGALSLVSPERLGENQVYFLPYLMGERSPINDTAARGVFAGMSMDTTRADLIQAVLEGVAFALRENVDIARAQGIPLTQSMLCGGGAKSPLWQTILAAVLDMDLHTTATEQGPGLGGAMLAMVAGGAYPDVPSVCRALVKIAHTVRPDPQLAAKYRLRYRKFRELYPALKGWFPLP